MMVVSALKLASNNVRGETWQNPGCSTSVLPDSLFIFIFILIRFIEVSDEMTKHFANELEVVGSMFGLMTDYFSTEGLEMSQGEMVGSESFPKHQ